MDNLTARPKLLKQANLSQIRKIIRKKGTTTRAEIAQETQISSTTVRSLLTQLLMDGEIESVGFDESSGGRKAQRYRLNPKRYYGVVFCILDHQIHRLILNVCGEILESKSLDIEQDEAGGSVLSAVEMEHKSKEAIITFLDEFSREKELRAIGIGVPGIVEGGSYWYINPADNTMRQVKIGDELSSRYGVPVVLENNINATTIGTGRCYMQQFPGEDPEEMNMAYLHFSKGCIRAGFLVGGRVIRGSRNFAGELGLVPVQSERTLDVCLAEMSEEKEYTDTIIQTICWICGILNPQYVALGGQDLRRDCVGRINDGVYALLPPHMAPEILYSEDLWKDYYDGMAFLTAGKMFEEIQFIKE